MAAAFSQKNARFNPYIALTTGVIAISTGAILVRLADAPSLVIAAYRVGLAALILIPLAIHTSRREILALNASDWKIAALSGLFLSMHFAAWVTSLKFTSVANSVVLVNTSPVWVGIFAPFITGEKLKPMVFFSIFLSVFGVLAIGIGDSASGNTALLGDLLALSGGVCAAGYLMMGRRLRQKLSLIAYVSICYGGAACILWSIVIGFRFQIWGFGTQTVAAFVLMALFPQLIGHSCYNWALKYFSTSFIAVSWLGEPIGATIFAYILFHEGLTLMKVIGGLVIMAAIYMAAVGEQRSQE
ncbi:MAG: DMT family transporter [Deltaproteobacteria bacterium]